MLILDLIYWKIKDIHNVLKNGRKVHLFGITAIVGIYGGGKTMGLVQYLETMRLKYGNDILIATNFFYKGQDFEIKDWKSLLPEYDKPVIFAYDELQNEFNSREYKSFPTSLMTLLTQNRKGHGKQIIYTTQDYETVDKNFRRLTKNVWTCKTRLGRLTSIKKYTREDYEQLLSVVEIQRKMKIHPYNKHKFIQTDDLRNLYDSYAMLESARNKTYVDQLNVVRVDS